MRTGANVSIDVAGKFFYGAPFVVGANSVVLVPKEGVLKIGTGSYIGRAVELGISSQIEIGSNTSIQDRCVILGNVTIGDHCLLSYNIYISSGRHYFDLMPMRLIKDQDRLALQSSQYGRTHHRAIVIEDDCWIGVNSVIMPGIKIGKGAVVGAGSVVTKDVAPYSVVAGAPAKIIRKRLEFNPPRRLDFDKTDDLPYFYAGCETSMDSLNRIEVGGIVAKNQFVLALSVDHELIHMRLKGINTRGGRLLLENGGEADIPEEVGEIEIMAPEYKTDRLVFRIQSESANPQLIIQKVWL